MGRSLEVTISTESDCVTTEGSSITICSDGTDGNPIKLAITVDGIYDNYSFSVSLSDNSWMSYEVERGYDDGDEENICIVLKISKNLSREVRLGSITIQHNCVRKIYKEIDIVQEGAKYAIVLNKTSDSSVSKINNCYSIPFVSTPNTYEEVVINVTATGGREKWYVKEVQQYLVQSDDTFKNEGYDGGGYDFMSQMSTNYDGVFKYWIEEDELHIRSYGQIDMTRTSSHSMRYFFILCHSDVDNSNCEMLDDNEVVYEQKILCYFDGNDRGGYESTDTVIENKVDLYEVTYDTPVVKLSYSDIGAEGGILSPTLTYSQEKTIKTTYTSGETSTSKFTITYGASAISYSLTSGTSYGSINSSTGVVTVDTSTSSSSRTLTVSVSVTANGETGTTTATITQSADEAVSEVYSYSTPVVSLSYSPSTVTAAGDDCSPTMTFTQTKTTTTTYISGNVVTSTKTITSGGTSTYSLTSGTSYGSINSSTGVVTVNASTSSSSRTLTVSVSVTANGETGTATATITQDAVALTV